MTYAAWAWLDVPFADKDRAKALGARWDPAARRWYAPRPGMRGLDRWAARPDLPALLPGEDRTFGQGLFADPVPSTAWWTHARSCIAPQDWDRVRRLVTTRAGRRCEACGRAEDRSCGIFLDTHERWEYDAADGVQRLRRLICLCSLCHLVSHYGRASVTGQQDAAYAHLLRVTGLGPVEADRHLRAAFALWARRSETTWKLDLGILTAVGVAVVRPAGSSEDRARIALGRWQAEQGSSQAAAQVRPAPGEPEVAWKPPNDHSEPGEAGGDGFQMGTLAADRRTVMTLHGHWQAGARAAYEEMNCLVSAGATPDELAQITDKLTAAHGDNAGTAEDQARAAGYLQMTADITVRLLDRRDAEREAGIEAGP